MRSLSARSAPGALVAGILLASGANAQVDSRWLEMWNEAQAHRPAPLDATGRIAPADELGTPLVIHGRVVAPDGRTTVPGATVFAYQTDEDGIYSGPGKPGTPWRLQGWVVTDEEGRFELRTVRPGSYPGQRVPAHVHLTVETRDHGRQWTEELQFADDPLLDAEQRRRAAKPDRFGGIRPVRTIDGVQHVDFTIRLKPDGDF